MLNSLQFSSPLTAVVHRYVELKGTQRPEPVFQLTEVERDFSAVHADTYELLVAWGIDLVAGTHTGVESRTGEITPSTHGLSPVHWRGRLS